MAARCGLCHADRVDRPAAEPDDRGEDPALQPARVLVEEHLALASSTWAVGPPGAVARFARGPDEPVQRGPNSVVTARGGLRVLLPDETVAIAYETPSARDPLRWNHAVAFCVPEEVARRAARTSLTELGPDTDALRPQDTGGVLFDLGLGTPAADVLVRTADPDALARLRAAEGQDLLDTDLQRTGVLAGHVVVLTAAGRMEVIDPGAQPAAAVPAAQRAAGAGPHLRLRPARARALAGPPAPLPIPAGWVPVLRLRPAHPAADPDGRPVPFDAARHEAFQALLAEHGDPVLGVVAVQVRDAVRAGRGPESASFANDPVTRATVAVALRRLALTDGTSGTLAAWRGRYGPAPGPDDAEEEWG